VIISASRRTDIPTYYSEWLFNRLKEEYVLVRNPMNIHQISKINLSPDIVDGIVFWTKNPIPMLDRLSELEKYKFYFQFTLNSYSKDVEPNIPSKSKIIIPAFQKLSKAIGREKVIWRYDPIFFNETYTMEYHCKYFKILAAKLGDYTEKCTVSFLDLYRDTVRNTRSLHIQQETKAQQIEIMQQFSEIAKQYGFYIDTCAESVDFSKFDITHAHCIDKERFERIGKYRLLVEKDSNQRPECGCIASIDIGTYNTCKNGCLYCYANYSHNTVVKNTQKHNPHSALLFGEIHPDDVIKERKVKSCKECQTTLFDYT
jgi:DNA repair photolyase